MNTSDNMQVSEAYVSTIRNLIGENAQIKRAESGLVNAVFLVDEKYVFRFPRDDEIYRQQVFERDVCSYLASYTDGLPYAILKPVDMTVDHSFVYEYIPGEVMSEQVLLAMGHDQQEKFVQDLLKFISWLGETLKPEKYKEIVASSDGKPIEHWEEYIQRTVVQLNDPNYPSLIEVNHELLAEMNKHYPAGIAADANRVIHDDLHMGNLLFVDSKLSGVIDFGNIMIGDLACELRHFYRLSPGFARWAIEIYEKNYGQKIDFTKVAWWGKINDAATLSDKIIAGKVGSPSYERARSNLAKWYSDKSWNI